MHVIGVLLGAETHEQLDAAVRALLSSVQASFHEVVLSTADEFIGEATTVWGDSARIAATQSLSRIVYSGTPITVTPTLTTITTGAAGASVGSLDITIGDENVTVPLALSTALDDPGPGWRLTHARELF